METSSPSSQRGRTTSSPARSFWGQEKSRVVTKGAIRVGRTRPIPSGIGIISPRARMWTRRGSFVRMIASPRPSSRASSVAAGR